MAPKCLPDVFSCSGTKQSKQAANTLTVPFLLVPGLLTILILYFRRRKPLADPARGLLLLGQFRVLRRIYPRWRHRTPNPRDGVLLACDLTSGLWCAVSVDSSADPPVTR